MRSLEEDRVTIITEDGKVEFDEEDDNRKRLKFDFLGPERSQSDDFLTKKLIILQKFD